MITKDDIRTYISITLLEGSSREPIGDDQDLLISGLLDSLNVMKLAQFLEETCGITIPAQDVVLENFATITQMYAYLTTRGATAGATPAR
jgi:acyl carrier protein